MVQWLNETANVMQRAGCTEDSCDQAIVELLRTKLNNQSGPRAARIAKEKDEADGLARIAYEQQQLGITKSVDFLDLTEESRLTTEKYRLALSARNAIYNTYHHYQIIQY